VEGSTKAAKNNKDIWHIEERCCDAQTPTEVRGKGQEGLQLYGKNKKHLKTAKQQK